MSVSAAELPAMSSATGTRGGACGATCAAGSTRGCGRSRSSSCRRPWRSSPSATSSPARCYQIGRVHARDDASTSGASSRARPSGCCASTLGRLYSSTYYALHDTRTPLRFAAGPGRAHDRARATSLALPLPSAAGHRSASGARPGSPLGRGWPGGWSSCCCGARCNRRIGATRPAGRAGRPAVGRRPRRAGAAGWLLRVVLPRRHPIAVAALVLAASTAWCTSASADRAACRRRGLCSDAFGLSLDAPRRSAVLTRC